MNYIVMNKHSSGSKRKGPFMTLGIDELVGRRRLAAITTVDDLVQKCASLEKRVKQRNTMLF